MYSDVNMYNSTNSNDTYNQILYRLALANIKYKYYISRFSKEYIKGNPYYVGEDLFENAISVNKLYMVLNFINNYL
tara:strand:- start:21 stop:248 length:228 start_codon:yes stop_codon:yes gene_type:complete